MNDVVFVAVGIGFGLSHMLLIYSVSVVAPVVAHRIKGKAK
jgi:hypothetical protein